MTIIHQSFQVRFEYPVVFTRDVFSAENDTLRDLLRATGQRRHRVVVAIDSGVLSALPDLPQRIERYAETAPDLIDIVDAPLIVRGGEACKHDAREVEEIYGLVERHRICRHSFVLAIGGGSVLDAVGMAAATAHRGIRLLRLPTTVLAQNDAGVGVKNAINFKGRKNFVGTFATPFAVINDSAFLGLLGRRELRSGIAEAIKVALIRDADFFHRLYEQRRRLAVFEAAAMEALIVRCAELHLAHIATSGDPFELGSARPLDFGHWSAHKLEELSQNALRHGEAVAVGIALDAIYSHRIGRLPEEALRSILSLLEDVGFDLGPPVLLDLDVSRALEDFREHIGGRLSITLLDAIGCGVEVDTIDVPLMEACRADLVREPARLSAIS